MVGVRGEKSLGGQITVTIRKDDYPLDTYSRRPQQYTCIFKHAFPLV